MTINVGGASGGDTKFTTMNMSRTTAPLLQVKTSQGAAVQLYSAISTLNTISAATPLWSYATLQPIVNTSEQVVVDITGEGVLTNVISPYVSTPATHTIRIEIDGGDPIEFVLSTNTANQQLILGYISTFLPVISADSNIGLGSYSDLGFTTAEYAIIHTPLQVILESSYGLKFKTSLKITVQCSVNFLADASSKAYAFYTTFIPKGL